MTFQSPQGTTFGSLARSSNMAHVQEAMRCLENWTFVKEFFVSTAQILALNATPVTLLAAPGAGKMIIFRGASVFLDYNSIAYGGIAATEDLVFRYTDGSGQIVGGVEATGFLDQTADSIRYCYAASQGAAPISSIVPVANAALVLHMAVGEITTGNSPLKLRVQYTVAPSDLSYIDSTYTTT